VTATAENQSFGYDANGNRTTQAVAGIGRTYSTATANNRLTGISGGLSRTYGFDANGNRTSESGDNGTHDYVYDGFNRLVQHTKNGIVTNYQINALGQRAHKRTSASEQTWFGWGRALVSASGTFGRSIAPLPCDLCACRAGLRLL
jgi:YD repeat-containing protein